MNIYSRYVLPPKVLEDNAIPSKTQQHFKDECDINMIIARSMKTGSLTDPTRPATALPMYGDFSSVADFHSAQNIIAEANQAFEQMSSAVRKRFNNNPAELLAFLEVESNRDEAIALGLVNANVIDNDISRDVETPVPIPK